MVPEVHPDVVLLSWRKLTAPVTTGVLDYYEEPYASPLGLYKNANSESYLAINRVTVGYSSPCYTIRFNLHDYGGCSPLVAINKGLSYSATIQRFRLHFRW
ncbi:MAG: hypothetical protein QXV51_02135 [Thermosphaera sp.]